MKVGIDSWSIQNYINYAKINNLVYSQGKLVDINSLKEGITYTPITKDWKIEQLYKLFKDFFDRTIENMKLIVQCNYCKDILSDNINTFQTCSCGRVSIDTANPKGFPFTYRIVANEINYTILKGKEIFE